ncbi:hypothetical protein A1A1_09241 [Planococcus antarcticus DSM 14505]|uniref:Sigma-X negative effector n=1 Tax=Planococcus antarcticus DSM 14505 TaxID=1185653 RepID=A0A1C7DGW2_9BACL|nr:hypothetical protein [Planococcus antarcticus]ANU10642.1 hypothetical protein BBH88_10135 [Planococcus antarcticus DSM 14505]EIM06728.1 hypothetical protein A1A1_09241 [Planococcus antarcticus DSM 14505]
MPNNKWTDESIEDLLKDFPAIKDNRPKEEVYNRLAKKQKVQKRPKKWLPLLVAALAFITVGILVASIISQLGIDTTQNQSDSSTESTATTEDQENEELESLPDAEESGTGESGQFSIAQVEEPVRTAVYDETIGNQTLMTIGLTENAVVVPVSFLIPSDQVEAAFGDKTPSSLDLYKEYADEIDETQLGFDEYHPYVGTLEKTAQGIRHMLPQDHQYDMASASIGVYFNTLSETFSDVSEIEVANEDGSAAGFSEIGPVEPIIPAQEDIAYYSFTSSNGDVYLVPGYDMPLTSASEAIGGLTESPSDFYGPTVPKNVDYQVSETQDLVQVEFEDALDLNSLDTLETIRMIESFALTADTFGKKVEVIGLQPESWNGFDFSQPLPVPVAPNLLEWSLE